MNTQKKQEITGSLEVALQKIERAQTLFQNGNLMHALKALRQAREYIVGAPLRELPVL